MYKVDLSPVAQRFYAAAELTLAKKLARCFQQLEKEPRARNNAKPLYGRFAGAWRYRVGDYRVIYEIDDAAYQVRVLAIVHRREAYD